MTLPAPPTELQLLSIFTSHAYTNTPTHTEMLTADSALKRSPFSSQPTESVDAAPETKRIKRPYHHHHQLQSPVVPVLAEPAIADNETVDYLVTRSIGQSLREEGFELADPVALDGFRNALEECMFQIYTYPSWLFGGQGC